ncbi:MAG: hypothetical protein HYW86_03605 [Candidatus Roizmanbacteria bacterium]|nr:MAG: hypothetical protein HYW86_03605 [Candidatus Roizmanbacteria bacterium]
MIPLIIVSNDQKRLADYIKKIIKDESFLSNFIYSIKPVKTELAIDQIRLLKKELKISFSNKRLFIIEALDVSGLEVQNALLKTLEENHVKNQFIFPLKNIEKILPTIRSRTKIINLNDFTNYKISPSTKTLLEITEKNDGLSFLNQSVIQSPSKEDLIQLLEEIIFYYRQRLAVDGVKASKIIKKIMSLKDLLQNNNLNPQLTIDNILLFIHKIYS